MNAWPKNITVDKRIVRILSESTYDNFPNALKEIITNSYDADAKVVKVNIDTKKEIVTIEDDGWGLNEEEFDFYLRIAGKKRAKANNVTPSGRKIIGQFGVGFLSVFPFFKNYYIESKKSGSDDILFADIPCYLYFKADNVIDISQIKVSGGIKKDKSNKDSSFTRVKLSGFTELGRIFFFPKKKESKPKSDSIASFSRLEYLCWRLSEDLPLQFKNEKFDAITKQYSPNLPFEVVLNNETLIRPIYGQEILEMSSIEFGAIKCEFFFLTDRKSVKPIEARYLKIRNLNAGVGKRENFGLGTDIQGARSRLHQLTGEIHILDGLNELITVSRDGFNYSPDYEKMKEFFIKKMNHFSNRLEKEANEEKFKKESADSAKITNIKLFKQEVRNQKIEQSNNSNFLGNKKNNLSNKKPIQKETLIPDEKEGTEFIKKLKIKGITYVLKIDKWDYKKSDFPAIRLEENVVYINESYPLFKGAKHTDIFIKLHIMLIRFLLEKELKKDTFDKFQKDILIYFKDYYKEK